MFNKRLCVFFLLVVAHYVHSSYRNGTDGNVVSICNSPLHLSYVQTLHVQLEGSDSPDTSGEIASPVTFHTTPQDVNASNSLSPLDTAGDIASTGDIASPGVVRTISPYVNVSGLPDTSGEIASPVAFHTTPQDVNTSSSLSPLAALNEGIVSVVSSAVIPPHLKASDPSGLTDVVHANALILESRETNAILRRSDEDGNDLPKTGISRSKARVSSGNLDELPKAVAAVATILVSGIAGNVDEDGNDLQGSGISRSKARVSSGNLDELPKAVAAVLVSGITGNVVEVTSVADKKNVLPAPAEKTYCNCCW